MGSFCYTELMKPISKVVLRDKEITDQNLINLILVCLVETGGIQHVSRNLAGLGYSDFSDEAYTQLEKSDQTQVLDFSNLSANQFHVICTVIFATVKEIEGDTIIQTPFDEGIELLRGV